MNSCWLYAEDRPFLYWDGIYNINDNGTNPNPSSAAPFNVTKSSTDGSAIRLQLELQLGHKHATNCTVWYPSFFCKTFERASDEIDDQYGLFDAIPVGCNSEQDDKEEQCYVLRSVRGNVLVSLFSNFGFVARKNMNQATQFVFIASSFNFCRIGQESKEMNEALFSVYITC